MAIEAGTPIADCSPDCHKVTEQIIKNIEGVCRSGSPANVLPGCDIDLISLISF